jgi:hypothetical protein
MKINPQNQRAIGKEGGWGFSIAPMSGGQAVLPTKNQDPARDKSVTVRQDL